VKNARLAAILNLIPFGYGYLYLGNYWTFGATFLAGICTFLMGFVLGPVAIDWLLMTLFAKCGYTFAIWCPGERPIWSSIIILIVWLVPPIILLLITAKNAFNKAISPNTILDDPAKTQNSTTEEQIEEIAQDKPDDGD